MSHSKQRFPRYTHFATICTASMSCAALLIGATASAQGLPRGERASGDFRMPSQARPAPSPQPSPAARQRAYGPSQGRAYGRTPAGYRYQPRVPTQPQPTADEGGDEEQEDPNAPPNFDLALGTLVPLSIGPQASIELPGRLLLQTDVGWMPPAYGSLINGMVQSFGGYDARFQSLVDGALEDALVVRATGGWRPFPDAGFELFGGYTMVDVGGSTSPAAVAGAIGGDFAAAVAEDVVGDTIEIDSQLHGFHVGLGWRWVAFEHLVIRANAAYTQAVSSSSSVTTPDAPEIGEEATPVVDERLGEIYDSYVKLPVVGLSTGYRF